MPQRRRIDRAAAAAAYAAGASLGAIARQQDVSRQAVAALAKAEGWARTEVGAALAATVTGQRLLHPKTYADRKLVAEGKRDFLAMQTITRTIAAGGTRGMAATAAGISGELLRQWLIEDPDFLSEVERAEGEKGLRRVAHLEAAAERGDTPAARFLLERDPSSRAEWAATPAADPGAGPALVLNIVLPGSTGAALAAQPQQPNVLTLTTTSQPAPVALDHDPEQENDR